MMKLRLREPNIFSMSALDLFASALGAFMLLAIIALPHFGKTHWLDDETLLAKLDDERAGRAEAERQRDEAEAQSQKLKDALEESQKALADAKRRTTLLGIETKARRIVLVVDLSGSMNMQGVDFRPVLANAVKQILDNLDGDAELALIGFHAPSNAVSLPAWPVSGLASLATNRATLEAELAAMMDRVDGGTPTRDALFSALERNPEAIVILTDGAPTVPDENWQRVVDDVTARNAGRSEIHAVAVGPFQKEPEFVLFLSALTERNRGHLAAAVR
jgi:uncharacterized protein YegL